MKGYCGKCGKYGNIEKHHILPLSTFGNNEETIKLCPNCHTAYHTELGKINLKNPSVEFHIEKFYRWMCGFAIVLALVWLVL